MTRGGNTPRLEGAAFEDVLAWQHQAYLQHGRAAIYHNKIAGKFVGRGLFVPDPEKSRPDYSGTRCGGLSVHFDAKTMGDVVGWTLPEKREHQYRELLEQATMGALCFFLVECRPMGAAFLLRVHPSVPVGENGRPSMIFRDVPLLDQVPDRGPGGRCYLTPAFCINATPEGLYDWLSAVELVWLDAGRGKPGRPPTRRPWQKNLGEELDDLVRAEEQRLRPPKPSALEALARRDNRIAELYTNGRSPEQLCKWFRIKKRSLQRILKLKGIAAPRGRPRKKTKDQLRSRGFYISHDVALGVHQGRLRLGEVPE